MSDLILTQRLYENDAYLTECEARVIELEEAECEGERKLRVILDRTVFFPEGGGQSPDTGWILSAGGGASGEGLALRVTDVQIADGVIRHTVVIPAQDADAEVQGKAAQDAVTADSREAAQKERRGRKSFCGLNRGDTVTLRIDWERRFGFMQNHTGEHILSGLMHGRYGFDNIGFHLSDHSVTLDVNGQLDEEEILALEWEANEVVYKNLPVQVSYPSEEALQTISYRSKIEIEGQIRLVTIPGVDVCACCATHVGRTGEIGLIKIIRTLRYKGGMRLFIACGRRALELMQKRQQRVEEVSHLTNRSQDEIGDGVRHLLEEIGQLKQKNRDLEYKAAFLYLATIPAAQRDVFLFVGDMDTIVQRNLVNRLTEEHEGVCGVFCGDDEAGYRYIIGSRSADCKMTQKKLREALGAKGGGKPEMIQGSVSCTREAAESVLLA